MTTVTHEKVESNDKSGIDYSTVMETFGCQMITDDILTKMRTVTKQEQLHSFFENNIFFAHRDFDKLLDNCLKTNENNFYIYTGRGPSTPNLHLGHLIPFMMAKYLQDIFDVPVIIQITDDEKFYHSKKEGARLHEFQDYAIENIKDIIACGFNQKKTFIFVNSTYTSHMSYNLAKIQKKINLNQIKNIFGYDDDVNMGKLSFPVHQMVPSFATTFPNLLVNDVLSECMEPIDMLVNRTYNDTEHQKIMTNLKKMRCLIVAGADQDPYFRTLRDVASKMKEHKPVVIYSKFLASLLGKDSKMSASIDKSAIFLTDSAKQIKKKINSLAFSGGQETIELHKKLGGNPDVDVAFQYLQFFCKDAGKVKTIQESYKSGEMGTGELKKICIELLTEIVMEHQTKRKDINIQVINSYLTPRCINSK